MRCDKYDFIQAIINDIIYFDNKLYKRALKKRGHYFSKYKKRSGGNRKKDYYWDFIELNTASYKLK